MTTNQEIDLYNLLAPKLGENEAKVMVSTFFNQHNELRQDVTKLQENIKNASTKEEIARIQENQKELVTKADLIKEISRLELIISKQEIRIVRWIAFIAGIAIAADKLIPKAFWVT